MRVTSLRTRLPRVSQACSTGFKYGDKADHFIHSIFSFFSVSDFSSSFVWTSIVVNKQKVWTYRTPKKTNMIQNHLSAMPSGCYGASLKDVKQCSAIFRDTGPHHHALAIPILFISISWYMQVHTPFRLTDGQDHWLQQ